MTHEAFFIVGCPRSGTTLLQRFLETHPDIAIPQETHFLDLSHKYLLQRNVNPEKVDRAELERVFLESRRFAALRVPIQNVLDELAKIPNPTWHSIWSATLNAYCKTRKKNRFGEKTPHHILYLEEIFKIFPHSKVIILIRDPRAVVASLLKTDFAPKTTNGCSMQWLTLNASGLYYTNRFPDRILYVGYENLVTSPKESLQDICLFLNIPFDNTMLNFHTQPAPDLDLCVEPWKEGVTRGLYTDSIDRWRGDLGVGEIRSIESRCGAMMRLWGYQPISNQGRTGIVSFIWICYFFLLKSLRLLLAKDRLSIQFFKSQSLGFFHVLTNRNKTPHEIFRQHHHQ